MYLCYVLAAEETATDEYRFELQPFCNHFHQIYSFMNYCWRKSPSLSLIIIGQFNNLFLHCTQLN